MAIFGRKKATAEAAPTTVEQQQQQGEGDVVVAPGAEDVSQFASVGDGEEKHGGDLQQAKTNATTATQDIEYPSGLKLVLLMSSIFISMFLVALVCSGPILFLLLRARLHMGVLTRHRKTLPSPPSPHLGRRRHADTYMSM